MNLRRGADAGGRCRPYRGGAERARWLWRAVPGEREPAIRAPVPRRQAGRSYHPDREHVRRVGAVPLRHVPAAESQLPAPATGCSRLVCIQRAVQLGADPRIRITERLCLRRAGRASRRRTFWRRLSANLLAHQANDLRAQSKCH